MARASDQIDLFSARLQDHFDSARDALADLVAELRSSGTDPADIVAALADPETRASVGLDRETLSEFVDSAQPLILRAMPAAGNVTEEMLTALSTLGRDSVIAETDRFWTIMSKELTNSVLSGDTRNLRTLLRGVDGLRSDQVEAAFNTTLNTYSRSVGAEVARNDPPDALYAAEGPADNRTRPICLKALAAGAMTREEWERILPGYFVDGGGYNCRHQVVPVRARGRDTSAAAQKEIDKLVEKERWRDPETPRQAAERRARESSTE